MKFKKVFCEHCKVVEWEVDLKIITNQDTSLLKIILWAIPVWFEFLLIPRIKSFIKQKDK